MRQRKSATASRTAARRGSPALARAAARRAATTRPRRRPAAHRFVPSSCPRRYSSTAPSGRGRKAAGASSSEARSVSSTNSVGAQGDELHLQARALTAQPVAPAGDPHQPLRRRVLAGVGVQHRRVGDERRAPPVRGRRPGGRLAPQDEAQDVLGDRLLLRAGQVRQHPHGDAAVREEEEHRASPGHVPPVLDQPQPLGLPELPAQAVGDAVAHRGVWASTARRPRPPRRPARPPAPPRSGGPGGSARRRGRWRRPSRRGRCPGWARSGSAPPRPGAWCSPAPAPRPPARAGSKVLRAMPRGAKRPSSTTRS